MPTIYLRGANTTAQWYADNYSGSTFSRVDKFLIHTTETGGWPGYSAGASAPNATYYPKFRQTRQHFGINRSARALRDPSSTAVRENRDNVFQLEIICYSDYALARSRGGLWVGDLSDAHMRDIAAMILQIHRDWNLPIQSSVTWREGRQTWYDNVRLSGSQFDAYRGILGHVHASGNTHWDPGGFRYSKLVKALNYQLVNHPVYGGGTTIPDPTVPGGFDPEEDDMPAPRDWTDADWDAARRNLLMPDLSRNTGNGVQMSDWAEGEWPDNLGTLFAQLIGYIAVYARRSALASETAIGRIEPNSWMAERWPSIPADGYTAPTYVRAGYGHARRGAEEIEDTVIPLLQQLVATMGGEQRDEVLTQIQQDLATARTERQAIADALDAASTERAEIAELVRAVDSGELAVDELLRRLGEKLLAGDAPA